MIGIMLFLTAFVRMLFDEQAKIKNEKIEMRNDVVRHPSEFELRS